MSIKRSILKSINRELTKYPIIALTGPRQSGKTTLLKDELSDYTYISLENPDNREYAEKDTKGFLEEYDHKVILDEVQRVPKLFSYLQGIVDEKKIMGQYILSGSQNFNLMEQITQSLAGRVALFTLYPFDNSELKDAGLLIDDINKLMTTGFYPAIYDRSINPDRYYDDYIKTYINRDVTQLINIQNQSTFKRFIKICATRAGSLINYASLAKDTGVSHSTARNWMTILETSYILYQLPPYYNNYSKRLTKSNKLYFYDTGLLCHLLNIRKGDLSPTNKHYGHIFENLVISEFVKQNAHLSQYRDYYFWRSSHGREVDLLFEDNDGINVYEVKATTTISSKLFHGLEYFKILAGDEVNEQTLIYGGKENQNRTNYTVTGWNSL